MQKELTLYMTTLLRSAGQKNMFPIPQGVIDWKDLPSCQNNECQEEA